MTQVQIEKRIKGAMSYRGIISKAKTKDILKYLKNT